jgi:hypothetical protein
MSVDAVVTWVDGEDPEHRRQRRTYASQEHVDADAELHGFGDVRFHSGEEIRYCLRSIRNFAPWIGRIWLVTDRQTPGFLDRAALEGAGITVVDHAVIFRGLEALTPTFNSIAIETLLWRIPGLSERFVYFNDDVFLARPTPEKDFFDDGRAVVQGRFRDVTEDGAFYGAPMFRRSAAMAGVDAGRALVPRHAPHPLLRSVFEALFRRKPHDFVRNAAFRFRSRTQFHPVALAYYHMLANDLAVHRDTGAVAFWAEGMIERLSPETIVERLRAQARRRPGAICVNNLRRMIQKAPEAPGYLELLTGAPLPFER